MNRNQLPASFRPSCNATLMPQRSNKTTLFRLRSHISDVQLAAVNIHFNSVQDGELWTGAINRCGREFSKDG